MSDNNRQHCYREIALPLHRKGFSPLPIPPRTKRPLVKGWPSIEITEDVVRRWAKDHPGCGIGIRCGNGVIAFDGDVYAAQVARALANYMDGLLNGGKPLMRRFGQVPKFLTPLHCHDINEKITCRFIDTATGTIHGIEILAQGQQFVAFGIHEGTGQPYRWTHGDMVSDTIPSCAGDQITQIIAEFERLALGQGWVEQGTIEREAARISKKATNTDGTRPGDIFNNTQSMTAILSGYGWTITNERGSLADGTPTVKVIRPGKTRGISGSVVNDSYLLLFSTSVPELPVYPTGEQPCEAYDCFGVFARYEHGGDESSAAKVIAEIMRRAA